MFVKAVVFLLACLGVTEANMTKCQVAAGES
jgi:hypothetical protein